MRAKDQRRKQEYLVALTTLPRKPVQRKPKLTLVKAEEPTPQPLPPPSRTQVAWRARMDEKHRFGIKLP